MLCPNERFQGAIDPQTIGGLIAIPNPRHGCATSLCSIICSLTAFLSFSIGNISKSISIRLDEYYSIV